jgi:predicted  nucleic acid-binding Zn-ribbon protein
MATPKKKKRSGGRKRGGALIPSAAIMSQPKLVELASELDKMNERDREISNEVTGLQGRIGKLSAEQHGIAVRRVEKQREFDAAVAASKA